MKMQKKYKMSSCWGIRHANALPRVYTVLLGRGTTTPRWSVLMDREMVDAFKAAHRMDKIRVLDIRSRLFVNI